MKLNPLKGSFEVDSSKFLCFIINARGIEANSEKIQANLDMKSPTKTKEVQRLTNWISALGIFFSKSTDKCVLFFNILRGNKQFEWTEECKKAFQELKAQLTKPYVLSKPLDREELGIYMAVTEHAISVVLIREENNIQHPVYYVSKRLIEAEGRYSLMEKLTYCLILSTRKLRPYFQAHPVWVYIDQPLRQILQKLDASEQLLKWAVELGQYEIIFQPRTVIKGQALVDFVVECTNKEESISENNPEPVQIPQSSNSENKPTWKASINETKYEALIAGLKLAREMKAEHIEICSNSQLVVNIISGEYEARGEKMIAYLSKIHDLLAQFKSYALRQIPRKENTTADALAQRASSTVNDQANLIPIQFLKEPSITGMEEVEMMDTSPNWMTPIAAYLNIEELPNNRNEARKMRRKAARYIMVEGVMYRRGFSMPLLRCVSQAVG
ncbi:hypothetical protein CsatB_023001 [Cannabis sativa]